MAFRICVRTHSGPFWAIKEQKCFSISKMRVCRFNDIQFSCPGWREENWLVLVPECVQFPRQQLSIVRDSLRLPVFFFFLLDGEADAGMLLIDFVENHLCICLVHNSCSFILALRLLHEEFHYYWVQRGKPLPYFRFVHLLYYAACNCSVVALYSIKAVVLNINKRYFNPIKSLHWKLP